MATFPELQIKSVWMSLLLASAGLARGAEPAPSAATSSVTYTFSVRDYGAAGDGVASDTSAINQAIDACSKAGGGQVLFPPGRYLSGTIHLRDRATLFLSAGATLLG